MNAETYTCRLCGEDYPWPDDIETIAEDEEIVCDDCYPAFEQMVELLASADPEVVRGIFEGIEREAK